MKRDENRWEDEQRLNERRWGKTKRREKTLNKRRQDEIKVIGE